VHKDEQSPGLVALPLADVLDPDSGHGMRMGQALQGRDLAVRDGVGWGVPLPRI